MPTRSRTVSQLTRQVGLLTSRADIAGPVETARRLLLIRALAAELSGDTAESQRLHLESSVLQWDAIRERKGFVLH